MSKEKEKRSVRSKAPQDRHSEMVHCKVTPRESLEISMTAKKCGMTVSGYLRARALGYEPVARLTAEEIELITKLVQARSDIANFTNAINGLTTEEKLKLFGNRMLMQKWYNEVVPISNAVSEFIRDVRNMKMLRPRTANESGKEVVS